MSILGSIVSTILHHGNASATPTTPAAAPTSSAAPTPAAPEAPHHAPADPAPSAPATAAAAPASAAPSAPVDVDAVLTHLAAAHHERLDWKHSIVDLLKVLNLDSSLAARKELAKELHYSGDEHDTATMNIWLHKEVIAELVKNGGKVPEDLKH
ncbi:MAG: DUF3597 domain-containing protein [Pseudomonadota bacterium]